LVSIKFTTTQSNPPLEDLTLICPACKKGLTNTLKAMLAVPCGHVLCKPCAGKFMSGAKGSKAPVDAHAPAGEHHLTCYVCDTDLCGTHNEKDGEKSGLRAGVVEIKSEGTGFAGAGTNMAKRQGVAFQC
jgi:nitric oxide synthase-interacting protein